MDRFTDNDLIDYLADELAPARRASLERALDTDAQLAAALEEYRALQAGVAATAEPRPSRRADERFQQLLDEAASATSTAPASPAPRRIVPLRRPTPRVYAVAATLLLCCFGLGWYFGRAADRELASELAATRSLMLELMRDERTSHRVRAATVTLDVPFADPELIDNLGYLLRKDPNANVRLAALDALLRFADLPSARQEMLDAMAADPPDVVRIQLMETLIGLDEKRVLPYLEDLIRNDSLPQPLRDAAQLGTFKLI